MSDAATGSETDPTAVDPSAAKPTRKARRKAAKSHAAKGPKAPKTPQAPKASRSERKAARKAAKAAKPPLQLGAQAKALLRAGHPRQALLAALVVGFLAWKTDRPWREVLVAAAAVLVVQLVLGLGNDVADVRIDRKAGTPGKPIAAGDVPLGNATYAIAALLILAVPLSLQNGYLAGGILLGTVLVGAVHNKWLHRGLFSWVGWAVTFAVLPAFVTYGTWGSAPHGPAPTWAFTAVAALLGVCVHVATSLPDLVQDHAAGIRSLPLRIALRTGAPRLLVVTTIVTGLALVGLLVAGLTAGIRQ